MRFRPKFSWLQAVVWVAMSVEGAARLVMYFHRGGQWREAMGLTQMLLGLLCIYLYTFSWWVVDDSGLIERKGWMRRTVPWNEVVRVGPYEPGSKLLRDWVEVSFARSAPMSDRGTMKFQPAKRIDLLNAIRAKAPQAEFDAFPIEA